MKQLTLAVTLAAIAVGALSVESLPVLAQPVGEDTQHTTPFFARTQLCGTTSLQGTYALNVTNTNQLSNILVAGNTSETQSTAQADVSDYIPFAAQIAFDGIDRFRAAFIDGITYDGFYVREAGSCIAYLEVPEQTSPPISSSLANGAPPLQRYVFLQLYLSAESRGFTFDGAVVRIADDECIDCFESITQIGGIATRGSTVNAIPYNPMYAPK